MERPISRWLLEIETLDPTVPTTFNIIYEGTSHGTLTIKNHNEYLVKCVVAGREEEIPFFSPIKAFLAIDVFFRTGELTE